MIGQRFSSCFDSNAIKFLLQLSMDRPKVRTTKENTHEDVK